jgi:hypothetical protein
VEKVCIMTRSDLVAYVRQKPFRPFRLVLSAGAAYEVPHSDLIMVGRDAVVIGQSKDPEQDFLTVLSSAICGTSSAWKRWKQRHRRRAARATASNATVNLKPPAVL